MLIDFYLWTVVQKCFDIIFLAQLVYFLFRVKLILWTVHLLLIDLFCSLWRSGHIALVGGGKRKRWIIATENMAAGDIIKTSGKIERMAGKYLKCYLLKYYLMLLLKMGMSRFQDILLPLNLKLSKEEFWGRLFSSHCKLIVSINIEGLAIVYFSKEWCRPIEKNYVT